ncbi:hypothetical protein EJD97_004171, partial [Solanum chilense]
MKMIPGEGRTYYSSDKVWKASVNTNEEDILYPTEFLKNLCFPGIPNHDINLKVEIPATLSLATCYAMKINKSQGQTLTQVGLYLPKQEFTQGQLYVAISRVTTREGLTVLNANGNTKYQIFIKNIVYKEVFHNACPRVVEREEVEIH